MKTEEIENEANEPVKPVEWQALLIEEWKKKRNQLLQTSKDHTKKEINYITPITKGIFDFQYTDISKTIEELEVEYEKIKLKLAAYESNGNYCEIDFEKVNTIEDIKRVLKGLDIRITKDSITYNELKDFIN